MHGVAIFWPLPRTPCEEAASDLQAFDSAGRGKFHPLALLSSCGWTNKIATGQINRRKRNSCARSSHRSWALRSGQSQQRLHKKQCIHEALTAQKVTFGCYLGKNLNEFGLRGGKLKRWRSLFYTSFWAEFPLSGGKGSFYLQMHRRDLVPAAGRQTRGSERPSCVGH